MIYYLKLKLHSWYFRMRHVIIQFSQFQIMWLDQFIKFQKIRRKVLSKILMTFVGYLITHSTFWIDFLMRGIFIFDKITSPWIYQNMAKYNMVEMYQIRNLIINIRCKIKIDKKSYISFMNENLMENINKFISSSTRVIIRYWEFEIIMMWNMWIQFSPCLPTNLVDLITIVYPYC